MFSMPASITNDISLEQLINSLKKHKRIAGIVIAGSSGRNELKPESDYDIVLVLYEYPYPMHVILSTIEGRMSDIAFWSIEQVDKMLEMDKITYIVELYSPDGLLLTLYEGQQLPIGFIEKGDEIFITLIFQFYVVSITTPFSNAAKNESPISTTSLAKFTE